MCPLPRILERVRQRARAARSGGALAPGGAGHRRPEVRVPGVGHHVLEQGEPLPRAPAGEVHRGREGLIAAEPAHQGLAPCRDPEGRLPAGVEVDTALVRREPRGRGDPPPQRHAHGVPPGSPEAEVAVARPAVALDRAGHDVVDGAPDREPLAPGRPPPFGTVDPGGVRGEVLHGVEPEAYRLPCGGDPPPGVAVDVVVVLPAVRCPQERGHRPREVPLPRAGDQGRRREVVEVQRGQVTTDRARRRPARRPAAGPPERIDQVVVDVGGVEGEVARGVRRPPGGGAGVEREALVVPDLGCRRGGEVGLRAEARHDGDGAESGERESGAAGEDHARDSAPIGPTRPTEPRDRVPLVAPARRPRLCGRDSVSQRPQRLARRGSTSPRARSARRAGLS